MRKLKKMVCDLKTTGEPQRTFENFYMAILAKWPLVLPFCFVIFDKDDVLYNL